MEIIKPEKVGLAITKFCHIIGIIPSTYKEALTYEEQIMAIGRYLEEIVYPAINKNAEALEELQNLFIELKDYVENYFDNLDVQEEINNKLDEMADSGTLAEIIAQYLEVQSLLCFNTKTDLKNADNLADGSFAKTYGENLYKDGKGHFYKIRTLIYGDVIDDENIIALDNYPTLIAEKVENYYIVKNSENIINLENKINYNKAHLLEGFVQSQKYADFTNLIPDNYAVSGVYINETNNKGLVVANNWATAYGDKFDLYTFDFNPSTKFISNFVKQMEDVTGHANGIAKIDETHFFIVTTSINYVYNISNNDIIANSNLPYMSMIGDYNGVVYGAQDYDWDHSTVVNSFYELEFDSNYSPSIKNTYNLADLREKLQGSEQSFVIFEDLIIFVSFANCKLCIYDFNTKEYLKTQLFTAPYVVEYEDGFVYNNKVILCDNLGQLFEPDIYNKNAIGGYSANHITKSLTDICLLDTPIKLTNNAPNDIDYNKFLCIMSNHADENIGTIGTELESITIYTAVRNFLGSGGVHNMTPIEIPLYKSIAVDGQSLGWYAKHWNAHYLEYHPETSPIMFEKREICGTFDILPGDSAPKIRITPAPYELTTNYRNGQNPETVIETAYPPEIYITKIIGHRKVGLGY